MTAPLIRRLNLQNFLSYGPEEMGINLTPLNVLIGPNGSGKSNLLEVLAIFRAAAGDLQGAVLAGGGIAEYIWKGTHSAPKATLNAVISPPPSMDLVMWHTLDLAQIAGRLEVSREAIGTLASGESEVKLAYMRKDDHVLLRPQPDVELNSTHRVQGIKTGQSILSQRRDPERYPELTYLADQFESIALFQEWNFGRSSAARLPQRTDVPADFLLTDASNLGLVLHDLAQTSTGRDELTFYLRKFYEPARGISTRILGGTLQLFIEEEGGRLIPATRLSDGTLRYLCLLAILCHPLPPRVIAIEEPELGLHPDIMPTVAELLRRASERTQLFVTTHSDALVSALSDTPESILVCEATPDGTTMKRLEAEPLREWLEKYSLGEIWRMGEIGGNRW
jgi:predicted ATPase